MNLKNSIVKLLPGLYILRHPKGGLPPVTVGRALGGPQSNGRVEVLSTPKTHGTILRDGADCIVMQVTGAAVELLLTAYVAQGGDAAPQVKIDQIGLDPEPTQTDGNAALALPARAGTAPSGSFAIDAKGVSLIGHIERQGDVVVGPKQRLGNPTENRRLEGFQVQWPDRGDGIDLAYSVAIEGAGALPMVTTGNFCGTRQEGRRITEVTFALVGSGATKAQIMGSAYFSGGFQVPILSGVPAGGPSGLEHLTALELTIVDAPQKGARSNPWDPSPSTQVFKTKAPKRVAK